MRFFFSKTKFRKRIYFFIYIVQHAYFSKFLYVKIKSDIEELQEFLQVSSSSDQEWITF